VHTISREDPPVGIGTRDFITEVLDLHASLDRDRMESLIDSSGRPARKQRAVAIA